MANTRAPKPKPRATLDPLAVIDAARPVERTIRLCLRGDLQAQLDQAATDLLKVVCDLEGNATAATDPAVKKASAETTRITAEMEAATVTFRLRGLTPKEWRDVIALCPPRKNIETDAPLGYNPEEASRVAVRIGCIEPDIDAERWEGLENEKLTQHQWLQLTGTVDALTHSKATSVPFS